MNNNGKTRILFVDDEPGVLSGLRRQLHHRSAEWQMRFAASGEQALQMLKSEQTDIIVSDMRMPVMNGVQLLGEVRNRWPATIRMILSGQADTQALHSDLGAIHQFLDKPCDENRLVDAIERARRFADELSNQRVREIAGGVPSLPVLPDPYRRLFTALDNPNSDINAVGEIVKQDVALSAKLLQMVNSAFFGLPRPISNPRDAVALLGFNTVRFIAMAAHAFDALRGTDDPGGRVRYLWDQSMEISAAAGALAARSGQPISVIEAARSAGMFALIGRAVFARALPGQLTAAMKFAASGRLPLYLAEMNVIGATQQAMGAHMLDVWAIRKDTVDAVAYQVTPETFIGCSAAHPLPYVHMARCNHLPSVIVERICPSNEFLSQLDLEKLVVPQIASAL